MKIYTQDEYYPFQLLSETIEIDPEDTLLMEAVEEMDDILKELKDLENSNPTYETIEKTHKVYSKFKRWWHSLDPDKKHKNLHKVLHTLSSILTTIMGVALVTSSSFVAISIARAGKVGMVKVFSMKNTLIAALIALMSGIALFVIGKRAEKNAKEKFDMYEDELESFEKYIDSIDEKIDKLNEEKKKCDDDKKKKLIDNTINGLKNARKKIVFELRYHKDDALGDDKKMTEKTENLKLRNNPDDELPFLLSVDIKDGKVKDYIDGKYKDKIYAGDHTWYNADKINKLRNSFRNKPYLLEKKDYDAAFGEGSYDKAMEKLKKEHPYDNVIRETKNKNVKEYIKVHPDEFNEYIYDYFFGKGAHAKAKSRYHESVELMNTAMRLVESGNIDAAQILLNQILSE